MKRSFYRTRPRRGVLLLVVLSVLLMFVVLALTYLMVATQYFEGASVSASLERSADDPRGELEEAFLQLLRDTLNPNSMLQGESLLADLYGNDGFVGKIQFANYPGGTNGQFIDLVINPTGAFFDILGNDINNSPYLGLFDIDRDGTADIPHPTSGFYNGRVVTILSGPAQGSTARIVRYEADNDDNDAKPGILYTFRVMFLAETNDRVVYPSDLSDARFIVNGRPFSGTGVGYKRLSEGGDDDGVDLDLTYTDPNNPNTEYEYALVSNPVALPGLRNGGAARFGGADEGYDAADYQNQFLAAMPPDPNDPNDILPSFHRRALIHYWDVKSGPESGDIPDYLQRQILKRPNPDDHPNFPPLTSLTQGPWDVDNDSDGLKDSVWIDAGFPVKTARDGRQYKPLVAFLCKDLDGRLNVNAHSNRAQANLAGTPTLRDVTDLARGGSTANLPLGQGYGPPEISLDGLFSNPSYLQSLLRGDGAKRGRYGDTKPGMGVETLAQKPTDPNTDDAEARAQFHDHPRNYWDVNDPLTLTSFGSPPDLLGISALGINAYGQPKYSFSSVSDRALQSLRSDSEYEIKFSLLAPRGDVGPKARDMLFSSAEMEFLLRYFDSDAEQLPSRIFDLARLSLEHRNIVTTDQFGLPAPSIMTTEELRTGDRFTNAGLALEVPGSIADLLRLRLIVGRGIPRDELPQQEDLIGADIADMMSPDLLMGLRMDINRPIGDSLDDEPKNAVVDEPGEVALGEFTWDGFPFDHDNDGQHGPNDPNDVLADKLARYHLARHLYVLLMTLRDNREPIDFQGGLFEDDLPGNQPELTTEMGLAQWAINAVDFRDADSIMTPFEFDINPFNGWDVDGRIDPNSPDNNHPDRLVVWGCERPELLITETLAFHDRKTQDLDNDDFAMDDDGDGEGDQLPEDLDFDQAKRPTGACFIELYNPWAGDARVPGELYFDHNGDIGPEQWHDGVILAKRVPLDSDTPNDLIDRTPVWRMVIVKGDEKYRDPDDPNDPLSTADIERSIYFVDPVPPAVKHGEVYTSSEPVYHITPGKFAVIGSAGTLTGGKYTNYIGTRTDGDLAKTRRIELDPHVDPTGIDRNDTVIVEDNPTPYVSDPDVPDTNNCVTWKANHSPVAVVIDSPYSLNISEPTNGYTDVIDPNAPSDVPFDANRDDLGDDIDKDALMKDGTIPNYRVVHLQRLANPLKKYNPVTNPYRTIDSAYINLTVFNGETSDVDTHPRSSPNHGFNDRFVTMQRGDFEDTNNANTLWRSQIYRVWGNFIQNPKDAVRLYDPLQVGLDGVVIDFKGDDLHVFDYDLRHTLGFLNRAYGPPIGTIESPEAPADKPFPWLTWLNRPYVSQYELMQVPKTSSSRLMAMFTLAETADRAYEHSSTEADQIPFGHLLNFFETDKVETDKVEEAKSGRAPQLGRIFDYLRVPSRFAGTTTRLDPAAFTGTGVGTESFHPPFNKVSKFRDPGRVNVNTIYSDIVWNGIRGDHPGPYYTELEDSRRGYIASGSNSLLSLNDDNPTFFANPVRSFGSANKVPLRILRKPEASVSLMRPNQANALGSKPLLHNNSPPEEYTDIERNSYFRYQTLQRTENLVTNRSNVFAIWITVGYFEVDENNRLGLELGTDSGQVKRHRAFYMVDRTIPVAFEPGKDHNVKRAVILRRFLE